VGVFLIALAMPTLLQSTRANGIELIKSLAFIPYQRLDGQMHPVVFVGWTLNYEMFFYVIFAVGLIFPKKLFGYLFTLTLLALIAVAGQLFHPQDPVLSFYTQPVLLEFGGGMVLGILSTNDMLPAHFTKPGVWLGLAALLLMLANVALFPNIDRSVIAGIPAFVVVACALMTERGGFVIKNAWVQLLGAASYSIYLTHFFATQVITKIADHLGHPGILMVAGVLVAGFALVAVTGIAVHRAIELPLTAYARWLLGGRHKPLPQAVSAAEPELVIPEPDPTLLGPLSTLREPSPYP
jgi:exopolysaccharide production protein ExoZ